MSRPDAQNGLYIRSERTLHPFRTDFTSAERVQKRALSIIDPSQTYDANMGQFGLTTLYSRRQKLCDNQFETISVPSHKLFSLLPPKHRPNVNLRRYHVYDLPQIHTDRFKHSFIPAMCAKKFLKT